MCPHPQGGGSFRIVNSHFHPAGRVARVTRIGYTRRMPTYAENIVAVFERATPAERTDGMEWYYDAHALALRLSPNDVWRGAGVIAAFSPQQKWDINVRNAENAFATGIATGHTKVMCSQAQRILDGEYALDVLKGDKVRAFCSAIADPDNSMIATIDRHAHDIAMGRVFSDNERKIGKVLFRSLSNHYREAAFEVNVSVAQIQAITWVRWRNEKGVR